MISQKDATISHSEVYKKNTFTEGGSTSGYTLLTLFLGFLLFEMIYTVERIACTTILYYIIKGRVRTLLEAAVKRLRSILDGWVSGVDGIWIPPILL